MTDSKYHGNVSISGFAMVKNSREAPGEKHGTRNLFFDVYFWMGDGADDLIVALRYFNSSNQAFSNNSLYYIHANAVPFPHDPDFDAKSLSPDEYDLLGDAVFLTPIPCKKVSQTPYIHVSGLVHDSNIQQSTFRVSPAVYAVALKTHTVFPVTVNIPDSPKYPNRKPVPSNDSYVTVSGYLSDVTIDEASQARTFSVELQDICFLGRPQVPSSPSKKTRSPQKRKYKSAFNGDSDAEDEHIKPKDAPVPSGSHTK